MSEISHDPITLEIIQNSLQATADEMFAAMRKTAMSSIIYEVLVMGTGILDAKGQLASSGAGIPGFVGVLDKSVKVLVEGTVTDARLSEIETAFHETYEREYTYRLKAPVELVGIHLVASAEVGKLTMQEKPLGSADASSAIKGERDVDYALEGLHKAAIYNGEKFEPGMTFPGPAVIEDSGSTIVIHPGNRVEVDGFGNIHIHLQG
jgi:hypothetical protein